jgi:hypothetical protein
MNAELVKRLQLVLQARGHRVLVDGIMGDETLNAAYQEIAADQGVLSPPPPPPAAHGNVLAWGKKVDPQFRAGVVWIAEDFGWNAQGPSNLMACIAWESDESFSPSILNKAGSGAVGLIQFMPKTARELGTTTSALALMSPLKQLGYVHKYLKQFSKMRGPHVNLADMYMSILLPSMIGKPDDAVLFSEGIAYRQNSGLDENRDGKVTKLEASAKVYAKLERGMSPQFAYVE